MFTQCVPLCPCLRVCTCASIWNAHYSYVNIHHVLSSLPWLCSPLFIDWHSEFISHCDSFLPGPGGKRIIVLIKSADSTVAHNAHCVLIIGQTLSQVECCLGFFYMRVHECVRRQWHIVIPLLIGAHGFWVRTFGKFWTYGQNHSEGEMGWRGGAKSIPANTQTNKRLWAGDLDLLAF